MCIALSTENSNSTNETSTAATATSTPVSSSENTTIETTLSTTSATNPTTSEHLPTFEGFQYLFQTTETAVSFNDSLNNCTTWGGNLVSIHSPQENDFVKNLTIDANYNGTAWIGLKQAEDSKYIK